MQKQTASSTAVTKHGVVCLDCLARIDELGSRNVENVYHVGNQAKARMGHAFFVDGDERVILCRAAGR